MIIVTIRRSLLYLLTFSTMHNAQGMLSEEEQEFSKKLTESFNKVIDLHEKIINQNGGEDGLPGDNEYKKHSNGAFSIGAKDFFSQYYKTSDKIYDLLVEQDIKKHINCRHIRSAVLSGIMFNSLEPINLKCAISIFFKITDDLQNKNFNVKKLITEIGTALYVGRELDPIEFLMYLHWIDDEGIDAQLFIETILNGKPDAIEHLYNVAQEFFQHEQLGFEKKNYYEKLIYIFEKTRTKEKFKNNFCTDFDLNLIYK